MPKLNAKLIAFIKQQPVFFVATAMEKGSINLSPKGMDTLRVGDEETVYWLNLTGSGNETATHLQHNPRMTIMFCAFEGSPMILRLYGSARVYHPRDPQFSEHLKLFPTYSGARQIIEMKLELVQTSCGFGVPLMAYSGERDVLEKWSDDKNEDGIKAYWKNKNQTSLDGLDTHILK